MMKIEKLENDLLNRVKKKLCGYEGGRMNEKHFEYLQNETGIGMRKLKELFGYYKKRSSKTYDYTNSKLAQFIGFHDWNSFVRSELMIASISNSSKRNSEEAIQVNKKVDMNLETDNRIMISVVVRGN